MASKSRDEKQTAQQDRIDDLRQKQVAGEFTTVRGNRADAARLTPDKYHNIKTDEADNYVHVFARVKHVDPSAKTINNEDKVLTLHKAEFDRKVTEGYFQLYDEIEVIHDPRKDAPGEYNLKPAAIKLDAKPTQKDNSANTASTEQNARIRKEKETLAAKEKELIGIQTENEKKAGELAAKEKALSEREAALGGPQSKK